MSDIFLGRHIPGLKQDDILVWVKEAQRGLRSVFGSLKEFIGYLNDLAKPEDAELLVEVGQFYLTSKRYVKLSFIKMVMILSIVERLMANSEFMEFYEWLTMKNNPKREAHLREL